MANRPTTPPRAGFTVVELLTVIGIVGLLAALILPAVQSAREAARQVDCRDRLRQLGLAAHEYEAARGTLPPGCDANFYPAFALLLPHLGETARAARIDLSRPRGAWETSYAAETGGTMAPPPSSAARRRREPAAPSPPTTR